MNAPPVSGDLGARDIHDLFLRVIHEQRAFLDALRHNRAGNQRPVDVVGLDPIVIDDARTLGVGLGHPDDRAAAVQRQHHQVVGIGGVNAPLLVRGDEVQNDLRLAIILRLDDGLDCLGIDRRPIDAETLAEGAHPQMILIELLAAGQGAPGDQLVDVRIAGVVANRIGLNARPSRRRDNLARLRLDISEPDLLIFLRAGKMGVIAAGILRKGRPRLHRDLAVGLRRQRENHFGRIDV